MRPEKEQEFKEILARIAAKDESLKEVKLESFGLGDAGALLLAHVLPQSQLTSLDLWNNDIEAEGAIALAKVLPQSKLTSLELGYNKIGATGIMALAQVLAQSQLTGLDLYENKIGAAGAIAFCEVLAQSQLTRLNLGGSCIGDDGVIALVKVLPQSKLISLDLYSNDIGTDGIMALCEVLAQSQLIRLNLRFNKIGDASAIALAKVLAQSQLTSINLEGNKIGDEGVIALAQVLAQSQLTSLNLYENKIGAAGAIALAQVLAQSQLTSLNLRSNKIGDEGIMALVKALAQSKLTSLDLRGYDIGAAGAIALAKVLAQSKLTSLNLEGNKIGAAGAIALAQVLAQSKLTSLNLYNNGIGAEGAIALAKVLEQSQLTNLDLYNNGIGPEGAIALAKVLEQSQLTNLDLRENQIGLAIALSEIWAQDQRTSLNWGGLCLGAEVVIALCEVLAQSKFTSLDLQGNEIGNAGAIALAKVLAQSQLTSLNLGGSEIGAEGAIALAKVLAQSQLTSLNLGDSEIGAEGAIALAKVLVQSKLTSLELGENKIGTDGIIALCEVLAQSKLTSLNLRSNKIGDDGAIALAQILAQSQLTSLNLGHSEIGAEGIMALYEVLAQSKLTSLDLQGNEIGAKGAIALAKVLAQSNLTSLDLSSNKIGTDGIMALCEVLAQSNLTSLDLSSNKIGTDGIMALCEVLAQSKLTSLDLGGNNIGDASAVALARGLAQSPVTSLNLSFNKIGADGATALAQALAQSKLIRLNLRFNKIGAAGGTALAQAIAQSQITDLDLGNNNIGDAGGTALARGLAQSKLTSLNLDGNGIGDASGQALFQAVNLSCSIAEISEFRLNETEKSILNNHLAINKLLNDTQPEDKSTNEFIQELECSALMHIGQPERLDDATFEKPKRLLLKAVELGSVQAIYLLGNLYLNDLKDLTKAKEYYLKAASMSHAISKLCVELIGQTDEPTKLELGGLTLKLPRRFSLNTRGQKLALREHELTDLCEPNALVSKTGISLAALKELQTIEPSMSVFVATKDYEPIDAGHLHFSQGQTIYIKNVGDIAANFVSFVKETLTTCLTPYNRDKQGRKRADVGFIPYDVYLGLQAKPRQDWSAEDVCNAIITPKTKPVFGEKSKPYVDTIASNQRGKAFEGYILSYARASKFADVLNALNERFKGINPDEVFIWIDLAGINQHAWMEMDSSAIGKILEVNLTQLFTHVSDGRLIHFDKARPTNLTRSWCLVELLSCLKAQEHTVAQTEICMASNVQAEVLAQDLMGLLNSLDSSKAECFNPADKIAIDAQIRRALTEESEAIIDMEEAFVRLNAVVKSWLLTKFLPDFSNIGELKTLQPAQTSASQEEANVAIAQISRRKSSVTVRAGAPLTVAFSSIVAVAPKQLLDSAFSSAANHSPPGLQCQQVNGDGHCLFTAAGLYLGQDQGFLRGIVATNIEQNMEQYRDIIQALNPRQTPEKYLADLRQGIEWADDLEIAILMKILDRPIVIVDTGGSVRNLSSLTGEGEPIFVQYNGHNHYDALILTGEKEPREIFAALMQPNTHSQLLQETAAPALPIQAAATRRSSRFEALRTMFQPRAKNNKF